MTTETMRATALPETVTVAVPAARAPGRWWVQIVIAVVGYELYSLVQSMTTGHVGAYAHAHEVAQVERHLHVWVEPSLNRLATAHDWIALPAGYYYELSHVCVTAVTLLFLWQRRRACYFALRNVLLAISLPALVVYALFPVAPPRLAVSGFTDTLVTNDILGAAHVHGGIVNLYAAMPSLHVAWALWCAGAVVLSSATRWRHLAWAYPALTTFVVLATANHFLVDAAAGGILAAVPLLLWRHRQAVPTRSA